MMICRLRFVVQVLSFSWLGTLTISMSFLQMVPKHMSCIYVFVSGPLWVKFLPLRAKFCYIKNLVVYIVFLFGSRFSVVCGVTSVQR